MRYEKASVRSGLHKRLSQLLHDPIGRRMLRNVEMQDAAAPVLDDEETVQHSEGRTRHGEKVAGNDRFAVVVKKRQAFLRRIPPALDPPQVARDRPLGEHKPSFCNSPWIFGAPQSEFSCAKRRIRTRIS